jgi:HPt (histidine-containing phosphotransfer) domain-containing protein
MLRNVMTAFRASVAELTGQIQAAIEADERAAADALLHKLKGSAAALSFVDAAQDCERLRTILRAPEAGDPGEALAALLRSLRESEGLGQDAPNMLRAAAA